MKIVYVVLHYNVYKMTEECIESIKKIKDITSEIVIIDNNSVNDSGLLLEKNYLGEKDIHVIRNSENVGFAKGNNIGYRYAKNVLNANIIVDMNNDILIHQNEFEDSLRSLALSKNVAVIAPKIINRKNENQNPMRKVRLTTRSLVKSLVYNTIYESCCHNQISYRLFKAVHTKRSERNFLKTEFERGEEYNVVPHGSCVIFLTEYINSTEFAFPPITFFYGEEDTLFDYLTIKRMKSMYTDKLMVYHMEKVSTNTISTKDMQGDLFKSKNMKLSIMATLKYRWFHHIL